MATYYRDFSSGGISDWTEDRLGSTAQTWSVSSDELSRGSSNAVEGLSWDDIDSDADRQDVDIVGEAKFAGTAIATRNISFVRGSGTTSTTSAYYVVVFRNDNLRVSYKVSGGSVTAITNTAKTFSENTWYWYRLRVNGTSIKCRTWTGAAGDEPGTWDIDTTDSNVSGDGFVGFIGGVEINTRTYRGFGVGTNGDTAPKSAGGTDATATLSGTSTTSSAGTAAATGAAGAALLGATTSSSAGAVTASAGVNAAATLSGASSTASIGSVTATGGASAAITGGAGTSAAGTVSASSGTNASITLTGAATSATVGALTATGAAQITLTGASTTSSAGSVTASDGTAAPFVRYFDVLSGQLLILRQL